MPDIYELADQFRAALLRSDAATLGDLTAAYRVAFARIEARLERLLEKMEAARARGEKVSAAWLFQEQRLSTLLVEVQREINKFSQTATGQITAAQGRAVSAALDHAEKLVAAGLAKKPKGGTVAPNFVRLPKSAVESIVGFLADGSPLKQLLNQLGPDAAREVQEALIRGVAAGSNPRRIASEVKVALGGNLTRALRIARTESLRAYREASFRSFNANADVVEKWVWTASLSPRTCAVCWAMHGTQHPITERMASHVSCRCTAVPITKTWEELGFTGLQETRAEVEKGEDAFAKLTPAEQEQVLGPGKFAEYQAGRLRLADLVGYKDHPRWGRSVYERSLADARLDDDPLELDDAPTPATEDDLDLTKLVEEPRPREQTAEEARRRLREVDALYRGRTAEADRKLKEHAAAYKKVYRRPAAYQKWLEDLSRLTGERQAVEQEHGEAMRAVLYQAEPAEFTVEWEKTIDLIPDKKAEWERGVEAFRRFVGKGRLDAGDKVEVRYLGPDRAYYVNNAAHLGNQDDAAVAAHELGHWLEEKSRAVFDAVTRFYDRRTKGDKVEPLSKWNRNYKPHEITKPDKFLHPYMGKVYENLLTGKRSASEIIAMGLELFYRNPLELAAKDPDYFDFIYDLMRERP